MTWKSAITFAGLMATGLAMPASAATIATATTSLNIRSGPGPQYNVVGAIPDHRQATIIGCIQDSLWCRVNYKDRQGWAYAQYMTARLPGRSLIVAEGIRDIPIVSYQAPVETIGSATSAAGFSGGLIATPTMTQPVVIAPPETVGSYVLSHPVPPAYLNGEVEEGVGLPDSVALTQVPGYDYAYAYVNNVPVLIEPQTRRVEYIYR